MSVLPAPAHLSLPILAAGLASFFTLGLIQAMYGPAFPMFQERYGVATASVGIIASAHFLGSAAAPPFVGLALRRYSVRAAVTFSLTLLALGVGGVAFAPSWTVAVTAALLGGLGLGGVSAGLNAAYSSLGTRAINMVNAVFGLGSMLAPLLVVALASGQAHHWPFLVVAALSLLAVVVGRVWGVPEIQPAPEQGTAARPGLQLALFALMITCYVGLEAGFGAWGVRYLTGLGVAGGALILSGFWGGMTVGRFLTGLIGARFDPARLVLVGAALVSVCAAASLSAGLAAGATVLAGVMLGPIFGSVLAWMTRTLPATLVPFLLVAASLGGVLMPWLMGTLFSRYGLPAIPLSLTVTAALLVVVSLVTGRLTRPARPTGAR